MAAQVVLLTGGNLGDVAGNLRAARERIGARVGAVVAASSVRESGAWGFEAPERFFNQVLVVQTALAPEEVLDVCQEIECELGRRRGSATGYASRTMDIDILFYDDLCIDTPRLTIPHPLIAMRPFVLEPLAEVLPEFRHPVLGRTVRELKEACGKTHRG